MRNQQNTMLWMKDLIEHMTRCHEQLQWAADEPTASFLAESLLGDLVECQRLCQEIRMRPRSSRPIAASA
jgi:hypothetical protein